MKDSAKYIPIDRVVKYYMSAANLTSAHYLRLYHFGVSGLVDLGMDLTEDIKTERLDVEANKTVILPPDYIQWVKVGVLNENGEVATLRRNDSLTTYGMLDDDRLSKNTGDGVRIKTMFHHDAYQNFYSDGALFNLFGVRNNMDYHGEFKVDDANNVVLLDNDFRYDYIILEYLANPAEAQNLVIPVQAQEALMAWIAWQDIEHLPVSRRVSQAEKQRREKSYYRNKRIARQRLHPIRLWDANEVIRLNNNLVLKS